jgi:hypothetical protein
LAIYWLAAIFIIPQEILEITCVHGEHLVKSIPQELVLLYMHVGIRGATHIHLVHKMLSEPILLFLSSDPFDLAPATLRLPARETRIADLSRAPTQSSPSTTHRQRVGARRPPSPGCGRPPLVLSLGLGLRDPLALPLEHDLPSIGRGKSDRSV